MKPDDIRRLYRQVDAATEEEYQQGREHALRDPAEARRLFQVTLALSAEDPEFARMLSMLVKSAVVDLISERVAADDAYALRIAGLVFAVMDTLKPPPKVKRGKQARTA